MKTTYTVKVANGQALSVHSFVRIDLFVGNHKLPLTLRVIDTPLPIVLGYPFLKQVNPRIYWKNLKIYIGEGETLFQLPTESPYLHRVECQLAGKSSPVPEPDDERRVPL